MKNDNTHKSKPDIFLCDRNDPERVQNILRLLLSATMKHKTARLLKGLSPETSLPRSAVFCNDDSIIDEIERITNSFGLSSYWNEYDIDSESTSWVEDLQQIIDEDGYSHIFIMDLPVKYLDKIYQLNNHFKTVKFIVCASV